MYAGSTPVASAPRDGALTTDMAVRQTARVVSGRVHPSREERMKRNILSGAMGAALIVAAAACSDSSAPPSLVSDEQESQDIAETVGDAVSQDMNLFFTGEATVSGLGDNVQPDVAASVAGFWTFSERCPFDAGSGRFQCPVVTRGPLTISRSFGLVDELGSPQSAFDPQLTAAANFQSLITGEITRPHWSADVERQRDVTVSGLLGQESTRQWDGTGASAIDAEFDNGQVSRTFQAQSNVSVSDVVVQLPRSQNPWPLSGTITHSVSATRTREGANEVSHSFSRTAIVTFNGTQFVTLQVGTRVFTLDLATGEVTPGDQ
jgi:hypothetical protein